MVQAVIFDMDGTLLDTLEDLKESVNFVLSKFNFAKRTKDEIRQFVGNGVKILFERALPQNVSSEILEECIATFKENYSKNMYNHTAPYNSIVEILSKLKENNLKIGVVSNKYDIAVKELSKKYFGNLIDSSIGQSDDIPQKPAPNGIFRTMQELGVDSAIYVGDSDVDIETAHNAGLKCIGVTWGFRDKKHLKKADYIINLPIELIEIIRSL